jgi:hypothetical protein
MQRREQQRRTGGGGGGASYGGMGNGSGGYANIPRYDTPEPAPIRSSSPAPSTNRAPAFKGSGMKLGSKKIKQDQLLQSLGSEASPVPSGASTPVSKAEPTARQATRGSLPTVQAEG